MEVTPAQLVELLRAGTAPPKARTAVAKGLLPLPPAPLLESLDLLADDPDQDVAAAALETLESLPQSVVRAVASAPGTNPALLASLGRRFAANEAVALELARNAAVDDATVAGLAALPYASVAEVIGRNQGRLERAPEILAALLANPATPTSVVQLWQEQRDRAALAAAATFETEPAATERFDAVLVEEDDTAPGAAVVPEEGAETLTARQLSIYQLLKKMSMGQKVALAVKGNREVRGILIRDKNRMLSLKVLENPRMTDSDIESFAKSTTVSEDVLRGIAAKKEWCKRYAVVRALVLNPKTPLGVSLDLVKRLTLKDLEGLTKNRNVPETLRSAARRLFQLKRDANR